MFPLKESTVLHAVTVFNAISRRRAAQQRTDKRLGGASRLSDVARSWRAAQGSPL
jgi:hypothetical protein